MTCQERQADADAEHRRLPALEPTYRGSRRTSGGLDASPAGKEGDPRGDLIKCQALTRAQAQKGLKMLEREIQFFQPNISARVSQRS